jgi:hypothetical protein
MEGFDTDAAIIRYMRDGDAAGMSMTDPLGGYELPWLGQPIPKGHTVLGDLYAAPAAPAKMLDDKTVNLRSWLIEETLPLFTKRINEAYWTNARIGRASILRDPYSAKPYVLFYVTAKAFDATPPVSFF